MEKLGAWKGEQYFIIKLVCSSLLGLAHGASTSQTHGLLMMRQSALLLVRIVDV